MSDILTGNHEQDRLLRAKVDALPRREGEVDPLDHVSEIAETDPRARRIAIEDKILSENPAQRRTALLDYIRRGRLGTAHADILTDIIQAAPALLDSGLVDLESSSYEEKQVVDELFKKFDEIKQEVLKMDEKIRGILAQQGILIGTGQYLNLEWYKNFILQMELLKKKIDEPNPKNPLVQGGRLDEYREDTIKRDIHTWLQKGISGVNFVSHFEDIARCVKGFLDASIHFSDIQDVPEESDPIKNFIYKKTGKKFNCYPLQSEYKGERVFSPPDFSKIRAKRRINVVDRKVDPNLLRGIIFDGNFGFEESGVVDRDRLKTELAMNSEASDLEELKKFLLVDPQLKNPGHVEIVDHHDALDDKQYDTATLMAQRFWDEYEGGKYKKSSWKERYATLKEKGLLSEQNSLVTMVNDPDVDAILSVWAFRNPQTAKKYSSILNSISFCGDFLVGSQTLEYGANPRDYNYIIMEYLKECEEKIRDEKILQLEMDRSVAIAEQKEERDASQAYKEKRLFIRENNIFVRGTMQELKELNDKKIERSSGNEKELQMEKGRRLKELAALVERQIDDILGDEEVRAEAHRAVSLKAKTEVLSTLERQLKEQKSGKPKLSNVDKSKIVSHLLYITEDILVHPFKYDTFLQRGREREVAGVEHAEQLYRSGKVEILPYEGDNDIIKIMPKEKMSIDSIDGLYFFLRRRVDFNKRIILQMEPGSYLVALNTQNQAELRTYDFNKLIQDLRPREQEIIVEKIRETLEEIDHLGDSPKRKKELEEKLEGLFNAAKKNKEGALWRNRNQMAFAQKSFIPEDEFLQILHNWKQKHDLEQEAGAKTKRKK